MTEVGRKGGGEAVEQRKIGCKIGRELVKHGAKLGAESAEGVLESPQRNPDMSEAKPMGDETGGFDGEDEGVGNLGGPVSKLPGGGLTVERAVQLDGGKMPGVEGEPSAGGKSQWVIGAVPIGIGPTGSADADRGGHTRNCR